MHGLGVWLLAAEGGAAFYEPPRNFTELVATVVGLVALITGLGILTRWALRALRALMRTVEWVESIHAITSRELDSDNGASTEDPGNLKDDVHGIAVALGQLQRRVDSAAKQIQHNSRRLDDVEDDLRAIYDPNGTKLPDRKADI